MLLQFYCTDSAFDREIARWSLIKNLQWIFWCFVGVLTAQLCDFSSVSHIFPCLWCAPGGENVCSSLAWPLHNIIHHTQKQFNAKKWKKTKTLTSPDFCQAGTDYLWWSRHPGIVGREGWNLTNYTICTLEPSPGGWTNNLPNLN